MAQLSAWLGELGGDITLNVAGSRESKAPGIGEKVREILVRGLDFRLNRAMLIC